MRKEISFEQDSYETCLVSIRNIFGFSINYVEDKIKKYDGKWEQGSRRFQVPIKVVPALSKELQAIDRTFYVEQIPNIVTEMVGKYGSTSTGGAKVKKQILIDANIAARYSYIDQNVLSNIMGNSKGSASKNLYHKILIICMESKAAIWSEELVAYKPRRIKFESKENETVMKEESIWLCSYENLWAKIQELAKYCFQTVIVDDSQVIAKKLTAEQEPALTLKKFLIGRHFVFPIVSKFYLNKLDVLIPLLPIILPQTNFQWLPKRYRKENIIELNFLLKSCGFCRDLNGSKNKNEASYQHYFHKWRATISEQGIEKIKAVNKKHSQVQQRKILQDPSSPRNKNQRSYKEAILEVLRLDKLEQIYRTISYFCVELATKLVIIIETTQMYRLMENVLCDRQISYCHYEHHQQVLEFNKNPTIMVCLIKAEYLMNIKFGEPVCTKDEIVNAKLENFQPQQYLCLSGVRNVLFPDIDWLIEVRKKEESIRELFRYAHGDIIRHYFILKGTYEEKWMKMLEETIIKIQMNLKVKEDLMEEEDDEDLEDAKDPVFGFCQLNLAKVQQEYSHLKVIRGVTDIDEEFDRLQFQALQQKQRRESKKRAKQQKAKQKQNERPDSIKKSAQKGPQINIESQQEQFGQQPSKKKPRIQQTPSQQQAVIYESITPVEVKPIQPIKQTNIELSPIKDKDSEQLSDLDHFKEPETEEVQIIQVRKPAPKPKILKPRTQNPMKVILRPSLG